MKSLTYFFSMICLWLFMLIALPNALVGDDPVLLEPSSQPTTPAVKPVGVNLGTWTTWGVAQMTSNILKNPGFEGSIDRILVVVQELDSTSFSDQRWQGADDDYWVGAQWEVRTGTAFGRTGTITQSLREGVDNLPQYFVSGDLTDVAPGDIIAIRKESPELGVSQWWISSGAESRITVDPNASRPGSSGVQSALLKPETGESTELNSYLDDNGYNLTFNALPVQGDWTLSFWAKGEPLTPEGQMPSLSASFRRLSASSYFTAQSVELTDEWQEFTYHFNAEDVPEPGTLKLSFSAGGDGKIWIDDVVLGADSDLSQPFRQVVVDMLSALRPAYLRDWQGQLSDSYDNRWSDAFGRKTYKLRNYGGGVDPTYGYSLPDFLWLAQQLGATPWIILPTTMTDAEYTAMGERLAQEATNGTFQTIYVEFGNENWNALFLPAGVMDITLHGIMASNAFNLLKQAAGSGVDMHLVVNGQHVVPNNSIEYLNGVSLADTLAIAPYYLNELPSGLTADQRLELLFAGDQGEWAETVELVNEAEKNLAVYEINAHTTSGNASNTDRTELVAGAGSGAALAKQLIKGMLFGTQPQLVFTLAQYQFGDWSPHPVRLWGIVRDLADGTRFRPTGLAVVLLNNMVTGDAYSIVAPNGGASDLTGVLFADNDVWRGAIVSSSNQDIPVTVQFPSDGRFIPTTLIQLGSGDPFATNETDENVSFTPSSLDETNRSVTFTVPAWSLVVFF